MRSRASLILFVILIAVPAWSQTLKVRHDHDPWGSCNGELVVTADGIRYETNKADHRRDWKWVDIQSIDRKSSDRLSVLTYEDLKSHLGLDRSFDFTILPGQPELSEAMFDSIAEHLARPVTDRIPRTIQAEYQVPVKHLHVFGGCEGTLIFGADWIVYQTSNAEDARTWRRTQIASVWSSNPFELELRVFEENQRAFDKVKRFTFQLKEPLDPGYYEKLRREFLRGL